MMSDNKERAKARNKEKRRKMIKAFFSRRIVIIGVVIFAIILFCAVFAPVLAKYDPNANDYSASLQPPSAEHILGTDKLGRDLFSRVVYGARVSLIVGVLAVIISAAIGTLIGMLVGYYGGVIDAIVMRGCEVIRAIPGVALNMCLIAIFGSSVTSMAAILGLSGIPGYIRMMRAQVMRERESDYIVASKLTGMKMFPLMYKHILPNCISPVLVHMTQQIGGTIMMESGLSFLGVGIRIPQASWGSMINDGRNYLLSNPYLAIVPGICIVLLVVSLNLIGDGVRDAMDPRLRGTK